MKNNWMFAIALFATAGISHADNLCAINPYTKAEAEQGRIAGMTWTAPETDHDFPGRATDERSALQAWLDFHRGTLLWKCAGLTHEQLSIRSVEPSTLSLLGLVRHMAEVEAWWFRTFVTGEKAHGFFGEDEDDFEKLDSIQGYAFLPVDERPAPEQIGGDDGWFGPAQTPTQACMASAPSSRLVPGAGMVRI